MGFWKKLFGVEGKKIEAFDPFAKDGDGDGKVQEGTIWERPADYTINKLHATIGAAIAEVAEVATNVVNGETAEEAAKRKRSEAAKKAAATRAAKKAAEASSGPVNKKATGSGGGGKAAKKTL